MRGLKGVLVAACVCLSLLVGVSGALAAGDANHPNAGECPRVAEEAPGFASLPDCRRYEMVTPPQKNGATIGTAYGRSSQVARSGQRVIAPSTQCFAGPESCVGQRGDATGEPYAFTRTSDGWVTHPLAPPASFETSQWRVVGAGAGTVLFSIPIPLGQEGFYARLSDGSLAAVGPLGEKEETPLPQESVVATADLSHVVYQTARGPVWSFDHTQELGGRAVYEYVGTGNSTPLMVGVSGGLGSTSLVSTCGTVFGTSGGASKLWGSLSEDGRTVYFTAQGHANNEVLCPSSVAAPPVSEVYARIDGELPDARSILISGPTSAACASAGCKENTGKPERARDAAFEGASTGGSRVFFADTQQLTDGASEDPNAGSSARVGCQYISELGGCNLYESECPNGHRCAQPAERRLIDVSEGPGGAPVSGGPRVQGVLAMAADGSRVYFVAKGVLTAASNARGESAQEEADNLYVYSEGHLAFIAALSPSDEGQWAYEISEFLTANTTPDGRFLVFVSHRALTPDDTRAEGPAQVFEYDAATRALQRISIGENGFNGNGNQGVPGGDASIVPAARTAFSVTVPVSSDPTMSDDGAFVFFQSPVALTPGALNDVVIGCINGVEENGKCGFGVAFASNVYEYHEGHVFLISDGKDTRALELLGSDASGANVFFATYDRLVPEDIDTQIDIYDAHICSDKEPCPAPKSAPVPCEGEACRGVSPGAPAGQAPGSESLTGAGNLSPITTGTAKPKIAARTRAMELARTLRGCRRDKQKRRRVRCERQARAHSGSARRTNTRRAK